jgi:hypothetical protein
VNHHPCPSSRIRRPFHGGIRVAPEADPSVFPLRLDPKRLRQPCWLVTPDLLYVFVNVPATLDVRLAAHFTNRYFRLFAEKPHVAPSSCNFWFTRPFTIVINGLDRRRTSWHRTIHGCCIKIIVTGPATVSAVLEEVVGNARQTISIARGLLDQLGIRYVDLPENMFGVGVAVAFGEETVQVISVIGPPNDQQVMLTGGIFRDMTQERLEILNACNRHTQGLTAFPVYLHDADAGWDILVGTRYPVGVLVRCPDLLDVSVRAIPQLIDQGRKSFTEAGIGGSPYRWNDEDINRLFLRSML